LLFVLLIDNQLLHRAKKTTEKSAKVAPRASVSSKDTILKQSGSKMPKIIFIDDSQVLETSKKITILTMDEALKRGKGKVIVLPKTFKNVS
jgi:hypothetical protein